MGRGSAIEWTDHTFNPWWGCAKVSQGCAHCYAEGVANRWSGDDRLWGPGAQRRPASEARWRDPERWNDAARKAGRVARVFCASMADVFEDRRDLERARVRLFALILETPWLEWQVLTKRPDVARDVLRDDGFRAQVDAVYLTRHAGELAPPRWTFPLPNVILGTSVEDQETADARIPALLEAPARRRFLSLEPLLGPVDLSDALRREYVRSFWRAPGDPAYEPAPIDWLIVGGESGREARPMRLEWARALIAQGRAAGVPVFVKQTGRRPVETGNRASGFEDYLLDVSGPGRDPLEWPADLRVREYPAHHDPREVHP